MTGAEADLSGLTVLLVEDEYFALRLERMVLKQLGIERVVVAEDGAEAARLIGERDDFDMIVSDWNLPHHSGLDLLRLARGRSASVAFVMVTGKNTAVSVRQASNEGVDAYLVKPFTPEQMKKQILSALARRAEKVGA